MADRDRLDGQELGRLLARADELLERVESLPGPGARAAVDALRALTGLYGEALARVLDLAGTAAGTAPGTSGGLLDGLLDDELLAHLLVLHGLHPEPAERRAARAVERLRPAVRERGGEVEPAGVTADGVARVRLTAKGCGGSASALQEAVREAVLAMAPELSGVEVVRETGAGAAAPAFVPVASLTRRAAAPAGEPV
ncbi:NifU family protein [Streptomyces aidingensis]|uniref:Fe-S cluster biogenesis protein NfuA, 4Fe-4S-binding domain n=1 Tax=Streptomyces aidingensis TaxID=910347 RepID=A0A1I1VDN9_9ACTN|nr:NifU family protein [Streptomyces aidingensis]SFD79213.1 Fe-S cluster biogenesis protein NfuA, 4Fe-4S-binding domain [Streptomyces aidingensis]